MDARCVWLEIALAVFISGARIKLTIETGQEYL